MIYFIRHGDSDAIKIGYSDVCAMARMRVLQCGTPIPLNMIGFVEGDIYQEKKLHRAVASKNISGEWYREDEELVEIINKVLTGQYDWSVFIKPGRRPAKEQNLYTVENISYNHPAWHKALIIGLGQKEYDMIVSTTDMSKVKGKPCWPSMMKTLEENGNKWVAD